MGSGIGELIAEGGSSLEHLDTSCAAAAVTGDVVILAVPYTALQDITAQYREQLAGRIIVDIINPMDFDMFDSLVMPADSSAAAKFAAALPSSKGAQGVQHQLRGDNSTHTRWEPTPPPC